MTFYGWDTPDVVYLYSASGVFLRQVYSTMQILGMVRDTPDLIFDSKDRNTRARVESEEGCFCYEFDHNVRAQDFRTAYESYLGMSSGRDYYLKRHRRKKGK